MFCYCCNCKFYNSCPLPCSAASGDTLQCRLVPRAKTHGQSFAIYRKIRDNFLKTDMSIYIISIISYNYNTICKNLIFLSNFAHKLRTLPQERPPRNYKPVYEYDRIHSSPVPEGAQIHTRKEEPDNNDSLCVNICGRLHKRVQAVRFRAMDCIQQDYHHCIFPLVYSTRQHWHDCGRNKQAHNVPLLAQAQPWHNRTQIHRVGIH